MTYSNVFIQTEGGGAKGLGRVYRSITLAAQLPGASISVDGEDARALVRASGVGLRGENPLPPSVVIRDLAAKTPPVLTHYAGEVLSPAALVVDIVDEDHEASGQADLTFAALGESSPGVYAGPKYAIIRQEFADCHPRAWERDAIVVCLGGVDPSGATMRVAGALETIGCARVVTITGPGSQWGQGDSPPVWGGLSKAIVAIVSPGATLLECAAAGVPALVLSHNEREHQRVLWMLADGCKWFRYAGSARDFYGPDLRHEVEGMLDSPHVMEAMSLDGRARVDGCGGWRVGGILRRRIAELEQQPRARPGPAAARDVDARECSASGPEVPRATRT